MMDMNVNSQFIIELRKSKAWSQQHLAEVSGLSLRTVQRIENSSSGAPDSIKAIAVSFGLVPADLMQPSVISKPDTPQEKNVGQLKKLIPVAATFVAIAILGTTIWVGSSSFTVIANGNDASPSGLAVESNVADAQQQEIMEAALQWLAHLDSGDYQASWQQSDPLVHSQLNANQWQAAVEPVRGKLGTVHSRTISSLQLSTSLPGLPDGEYAMLVLSTEFEKKADSFETLPLSKSNGTWRPMGYFIR